jgi:hypothetical protein
MGLGDNGPNGTCYACDRKLGRKPRLVETSDHQSVYVGSECARKITADGWQPPKGGPVLFPLCESVGLSCSRVGLQHR